MAYVFVVLATLAFLFGMAATLNQADPEPRPADLRAQRIACWFFAWSAVAILGLTWLAK